MVKKTPDNPSPSPAAATPATKEEPNGLKQHDVPVGEMIAALLDVERAIQLPPHWLNLNSPESIWQAPEDVNRQRPVKIIGDPSGNHDNWRNCLAVSNLIENKNSLSWTGGKTHLVITGDIACDRSPHAIIIYNEIHELRKQAHAQGGEITVISGNHDHWLITALLGLENANRGNFHSLINRFLRERLVYDYDSVVVGFTELQQFLAEAEWQELLQTTPDSGEESLERIRHKILGQMLSIPEAEIFLRELVGTQIVSQIDDTLFLHTPPTTAIIEHLLKPEVNLKVINQEYRRYLMRGVKNEEPKSSEIAKLFLNTNNRSDFCQDNKEKPEYLQAMVEALKAKYGINAIVFGHDHFKLDRYRLAKPEDWRELILICADIHGPNPSVAEINRNSGIILGNQPRHYYRGQLGIRPPAPKQTDQSSPQ